MNLELEYLTDKIMPYFESKDWREISELFDSLKFKYDKSLYHYENIAKKNRRNN